MTASSAHPRSRAPRRPGGQWPVGERSLLASVLGIPPVAAVGLAFGLTALGVFVDLQRIGTVGAVFQALYFIGCVLAVTWVRRRSLFGPLVQPPLLLAVAVPAIALLGDGPTAGDVGQTLLAVAAPLVNSFPTMATTTAVVLAMGVSRLVVQREPRDDDRPDRRISARRGSGAARGAARRPATPPRS